MDWILSPSSLYYHLLAPPYTYHFYSLSFTRREGEDYTHPTPYSSSSAGLHVGLHSSALLCAVLQGHVLPSHSCRHYHPSLWVITCSCLPSGCFLLPPGYLYLLATVNADAQHNTAIHKRTCHDRSLPPLPDGSSRLPFVITGSSFPQRHEHGAVYSWTYAVGLPVMDPSFVVVLAWL